MKNLFFIPLLILLLTTSCKKEPEEHSVPTPAPRPLPTPPPTLNPTNTALKAFAGFDVWLPLPANSCLLYGYATYPEYTIESYSWKKISGPASFLIDSPQSKQTRVTSLEKGTYEFELTVTNKSGFTLIDSVSIHVYEPRVAGANEFMFKNLKWMCPMGCTLLIENFNLYISNHSSIKVFIKRTNSINWIEVIPENKWIASDKYIYLINNNSFLIYSDYPDDEAAPVDVKIAF